jgi:hypothetical protein
MIRGSCSYSHVAISRAMTHHYSYGLLPINATWTAVIMTPADYSCVTLSALVIHNVFLPLCSWAHLSGLNILVCASLKL